MKPELLKREACVLVAIDFQEKLLPHIAGRDPLIGKAGLLLDSARELGIPVLVTEQYPKGLGPTVPGIKGAIPGFKPIEKNCFSCAGEPGFLAQFDALKRSQAVLIGVETHVCVAQTAVDLASRGISVFVAADACGSRHPRDAELALRRMEAAGVVVTGAEAVVFEWLGRAGSPEFKKVQTRVKEAG